MFQTNRITNQEVFEANKTQMWQLAPKAAPAPGQALYLDRAGVFEFDLDDYLLGVIDQGRDLVADRPYLCERRRPAAPDIASLIQESLEQEWCNEHGDFTFDLPAVDDLQAELDRRFAAAKDEDLSLWYETDTALDTASPLVVERLSAMHKLRAPEESATKEGANE
jgi:hypothetical protein